MLVRLSRKDAHTAKLMGADTVALCKMQGFDPRLENEDQSREEANILGYKAEFAVARLLDLEPPEINVLSDGGVDLWLDEDISVDVKFTNMKKDPKVIFDSMAKFRADIAILVTQHDEDDEIYEIHGWISRRTFKKCNHTLDYGYGQRLVMDAEDLHPIELLWGYTKAYGYGTLSNYLDTTEGLRWV